MATFNGNHPDEKISRYPEEKVMKNNIFKWPSFTFALCTFVLHLSIKAQHTVSLRNLMTVILVNRDISSRRIHDQLHMNAVWTCLGEMMGLYMRCFFYSAVEVISAEIISKRTGFETTYNLQEHNALHKYYKKN